ncbi:MAG: ATP-binding protein [Atopostipes suicloacalis]|nr:ATP-binding protein [Atopostipes suicloacalis]MDN6730902.1 ATP-binding protein [Atopostipes suicloacalis]
MKLSKRITYLFSLAILLVIFIVTLISNAMINNTFDDYLVDEQRATVEQISSEINELYEENDFEFYEQKIDSYASLEDLDIIVHNQKDEVIYRSNQQGMEGGMSQHHRQMMREHGMTDENYVQDRFDLLRDGETVGTVTIGYVDNSLQSQSAQLFKSTLTKILLIASVIAIVIGVITSILLANSLTKPLINIKNTSQEIEKGNLSKQSDPATNIIEIQELSDSINYLGQTLAKQEKIRKEYASDISHELRTPLSTLKSHVEAIMDGVWEPNEEHLTVLMHEINRLASLIDDLKDSFNSMEEGLVLHKSTFNLSKTMHEIVMTFQPIIDQEGLTINEEIAENVEVWMDPDRIKQVLYNLLTNAIKYTGSGGQIQLKMEKLAANQLKITVSDSGLGIAKKDLPFIFQRFYRIDQSRSQSTGGSGLGLAIVQSIIKEHGGEIEVNSVISEGSQFIIHLPIKD